MNDDARLWHPWLRINRLLRVMLHPRRTQLGDVVAEVTPPGVKLSPATRVSRDGVAHRGIMNDAHARLWHRLRINHVLRVMFHTNWTEIGSRMTLLTDLEEFVRDHRPHGEMTGDATAPVWNGYLLTVTCACGVVFERWVTPEEADADLLRLTALN